MKTLELSRGLVAKVDDADFDELNKHTWFIRTDTKRKYAPYAGANMRDENGKRYSMLLHRWLMKPGPGLVVDHKDGDTLNNQRSNLQVITHAQNISRCRTRCDNALGVKGVRRTRSGLFEANITHKRKPHYLGTFSSIVDAARAYMQASHAVFMDQLLQQQQGGGGTPASPTIPSPTPPPTANNAASLAVEQATFRQQLRRKNIGSTNLAPAGAYQPPAGTAPISPGAGQVK